MRVSTVGLKVADGVGAASFGASASGQRPLRDVVEKSTGSRSPTFREELRDGVTVVIGGRQRVENRRRDAALEKSTRSGSPAGTWAMVQFFGQVAEAA